MTAATTMSRVRQRVSGTVRGAVRADRRHDRPTSDASTRRRPRRRGRRDRCWACFLRRYEPDQVPRVCGLPTLSALERSPEADLRFAPESTPRRCLAPVGASVRCGDERPVDRGRRPGLRPPLPLLQPEHHRRAWWRGRPSSWTRDPRSPRVARSSTTSGSWARHGSASSSTRTATSDHCFGNSVFRPATIWGHERCVTMIRTTGEAQRASAAQESPTSPPTWPRSSSIRPIARSPIARPSISTAASSSSPISGAGTPTTTSWSRSRTPTCCASATCSRTTLRRGTATAIRWTGRRRPGRSSASPASGRSSCRVTAHTPIGRSWSARSTRSARSPASRRVSTEAGSTSRRPSARRPTAPAAAREALERAVAQLRGELGP